jgi:predicted esterase
VPFELARRSEAALRALRVPVETYYADFGHWITPEGVAAGTAFLRRVFAAAPA